MTLQETEIILNKINDLFDGKAIRTDRDGNIYTKALTFLHEEFFIDLNFNEAENIVKKIGSRYEYFPKNINLIKLLKDNHSSNYDFRPYFLTPKKLFDDLLWYKDIENNTGYSNSELFNRIEDRIKTIILQNPAKIKEGFHYLLCSPYQIYKTELRKLIDNETNL